MLPIPARNFWSINNGFSFAWRCEISEPKCSHDIAVSSGSSPRCESSLISQRHDFGHEHLAERAWIDEPELTTLGEGDHDVRVLGTRVARTAARAEQLARHAEMDHEHVVVVEPAEDVLAAPLDARELLAFEARRELLAVVVSPDRTHAVDLDRLHAFADELALEVATHHLDFRQLRHRAPRLGRPRLPPRARPRLRPRRRPARCRGPGPTPSGLPPAPPASSTAPRRGRAPHSRCEPSRRSASSGRGPRREPGTSGAARSAVPRAPG